MSEDWLEKLLREAFKYTQKEIRLETCGKYSLSEIFNIIVEKREEESGLEEHMKTCGKCVNSYAYLFDYYKDFYSKQMDLMYVMGRIILLKKALTLREAKRYRGKEVEEIKFKGRSIYIYKEGEDVYISVESKDTLISLEKDGKIIAELSPDEEASFPPINEKGLYRIVFDKEKGFLNILIA